MSQQLIEKILSETASLSEQKEFNSWLNASTKNRNYFKKAEVIWNGLDEAFLTKKFDKDTAEGNILSKISIRKSKEIRFKRFKFVSYAASFLVLISVSFWTINSTIRNNQFAQIYAAGNEVTELMLSDSTHVWLNAYSTLETANRFGYKQRKVYLKGEAYFDVKRDEAKPFKVIAGKTVTKVLGTSFNVEQDTISNNINVYVSSGKVAFFRKHWITNEYYLTEGAFAQYLNDENHIQVGKNQSVNYLSWKTGKLQFYNTPIQQVCIDLSKFYGEKIVSHLDDQTILTGTFNREELIRVLSIIKLSLGVEVDVEDGVYVLSKSNR